LRFSSRFVPEYPATLNANWDSPLIVPRESVISPSIGGPPSMWKGLRECEITDGSVPVANAANNGVFDPLGSDLAI